MKRNLLLIILVPLFGFSQIQIGGDINGKTEEERSGRSVSISDDGSVIAIGAPLYGTWGFGYAGRVRVYKNVSGVWTEIGDFEGNGSSGVSVSLSSNGSVLAIGSPDNGLGGQVRIYKNVSGTWSSLGSINAEDSYDEFGDSVSLSSDGSIVAIGAPFNDGKGRNAGHVRIYSNTSSGVWTQIGNDIDGKIASDRSGTSVSLSSDGSIVAIGAPGELFGRNFNYVRIFKNISGVWTQIGSDIVGKTAGDKLGRSVSLSSDGSIVAIGAPSSNNYGAVRVFKNMSDTWTELGSEIGGKAFNSLFGDCVSMSSNGSIVAIGAPNSSQVRIFKYVSNEWVQIGNSINGQYDASGYSVSISSDGSIVAIGAPNYDDSVSDPIKDDIGHVRVYDLSAVLSSDDFVLSKFSLSPNPADTKAIIELGNGVILNRVYIYNNVGQIIKSTEKAVINTSDLSTGLYYVEIITNKGKATKKLVIK